MLDDSSHASRRGNQNAASWTQERTEILKRLWAEGLTASQIASELGEGITRSGVLGKAHRMKLSARLNPSALSRPPKPHGNKGQPKVNAIIARARRKAPTPPPMDAEPFDMEDGDGNEVTSLIGIMENRGCKWISGDPLGKHGYCGQPFKAGSSWCPEHHAIVYPWGRAR